MLKLKVNLLGLFLLWCWFLWVGGMLLVFPGAAAGESEGFLRPVNRPALAVVRPSERVLLGVTRAGGRLVGVGERGIILLSDDNGNRWRQAKVPVSVTLTAVQFLSAQKGWAVGHWGVVLHTEDGGETWTRQLDGREAARIELKAAEALGTEAGGRRLADAKQLVKEGPDKPFLNLLFLNEEKGFIVGAYGLFFSTSDGGKTWHSCMGQVDNPSWMHIFAMAGKGEDLWLSGEKGFLARSTDGGEHFIRVNSPATASMFALSVSADGVVVLGGMEGNAYRSSDQGKTFSKIEFPVQTAINAIVSIDDGNLIFVCQSGQLLISHDQGVTVQVMKGPPTAALSFVTQCSDGTLIAVGMTGVTRFSPPRQENPSQKLDNGTDQ